MTTTGATTLRCSAFARQEDLDPVGSAGCYSGYLLVEHPLPWPRDIAEVEALAPVVAALEGTGVRLQGLVPHGSETEVRRIVRYRKPAGDWFRAYERVERVVPAPLVVDAAVELLGAADGAVPGWAQADVTDDVLVCTHGKRDLCCGSMGTRLAADLSADPARFGGSVRVWRTSHTGGHRFAPTAVVLPQGTLWAYMDADALRRVVARQGPLDDLLPRYRGCAGLEAPVVQALERAAFAEVGWPWLDHARRGEDLGGGRVRIEAESPSGERLAWEGTVEVGRMVPVPDCGLPIEAAKKAEPEFVVSDLQRTCI